MFRAAQRGPARRGAGCDTTEVIVSAGRVAAGARVVLVRRWMGTAVKAWLRWAAPAAAQRRALGGDLVAAPPKPAEPAPAAAEMVAGPRGESAGGAEGDGGQGRRFASAAAPARRPALLQPQCLDGEEAARRARGARRIASEPAPGRDWPAKKVARVLAKAPEVPTASRHGDAPRGEAVSSRVARCRSFVWIVDRG